MEVREYHMTPRRLLLTLWNYERGWLWVWASSITQVPKSLLQVLPAVLMLSYAIWALGPSLRALRRWVFRVSVKRFLQ